MIDSRREIRAIDLFCGAGGTSTGLQLAASGLGRRLRLTAINHWPLAIESHAANHPDARHICGTLQPVVTELGIEVPGLDPRAVIGRERIDLITASPECTHHSNALGGKPRSDQKRSTPWCVLRWVEVCRPKSVLIENVREFRDWAPLGSDGKPLKSRRGETYRAFLAALRSLGYTVEDRLLCAADYGDPTSRVRLFIAAVRGRRPVPWPTPTHCRAGDLLPPWRSASEVIDWSLPGRSVFGRKHPLAPRTLERIAAGIERFWGSAAEPFLVMIYGNRGLRSVDAPVPTVTTSPAHIALVRPFLVRYQGNHAGRSDGAGRVHDIELPLPVQDTSNRYGLVRPFLLPPEGYYRGNAPRSIDSPLQTVTAGRGGGGIVQPFLIKYHGQGGARSIQEPLATLTTKDRYGLVSGERLDITFRMLQPHELAAAMSFPAGYIFGGCRDKQVKQIGNAVPVLTAAALCRELLSA
jgi:DNA (cytosine-5)-methyltransferase 1